jgi:hypothetical protein
MWRPDLAGAPHRSGSATLGLMSFVTPPDWTEEDSRHMRERLALLDHTDLRQVLEVLEYMCSPKASWADETRRKFYLIQCELAREELSRCGSELDK